MPGAEDLIDSRGRPSGGKNDWASRLHCKIAGLSIVLDRVSCIQQAEGTWTPKLLGSMNLVQKQCVEHRFGPGFVYLRSRLSHPVTGIVDYHKEEQGVDHFGEQRCLSLCVP